MPPTYRPSFHQQAEQEVAQEEEGPAQVAQVEEHECEEQQCEVGTALLHLLMVNDAALALRLHLQCKAALAARRSAAHSGGQQGSRA